MRIMKRMGVNALRTSHNPPSPEVIDVCQRLGILMIDEAFDTWRRPKVEFDYGRFFDAHSDADIKEMVLAAQNSPSVIMWSIGNEIPDSTSEIGIPIARRLIDAVRSVDTTRPVTMGSDKYRTVPEPGSPQDRILQMLDGMGLNYNTAASVDALHARYPDKFFYEAESSSETSTRGVYQDPEQLNTGENFTPGRRATSSYDNNLEPWTYSGEYGLKKDRDRPWFAGQFLWSGIDYIGEPTPYYDVFPVKTSFFGAVDTAGFEKDQFFLFQSQWTEGADGPRAADGLDPHEPGEVVEVRAYANVESVELLLNGRSLGERRFDRKSRTSRPRRRRATTRRSPAARSRELHEPERQRRAPVPQVGRAVRARAPGGRGATGRGGRRAGCGGVGGRAGRAAARRRPQCRAGLPGVGDGRGRGRGRRRRAGRGRPHLVGRDRRRLDRRPRQRPPGVARGLQGHRAHGVQREGAGDRAHGCGRARVTASAQGLRSDSVSVAPARRAAPGPARPPAQTPPPFEEPPADASYSGQEDTIPAAMLDGDPATAWSNFYVAEATALLPDISLAHEREWVSLRWPAARSVDTVTATFVVDEAHALPAAIEVRSWDGSRWVPGDGAAGRAPGRRPRSRSTG